MKMNSFKKWLSVIGCLVLVAAMALSMIGCGSKEEPQASAAPQENGGEVQVLGEGATVFQFSVVDLEGNETKFEIHTDEATVGAALMQLGLIEGEDGPYGLYVKVVNGVTAIYEEDGSYWAFYENGQYAAKGVDQTAINTDTIYEFRAEKG